MPCQTCTKRTPRSISRRAIENLPGLHAGAVHVENVLRFAADVERVGGIRSACDRPVRTMDPRFERGVVLPVFQMLAVEFAQQIELPPLIARLRRRRFLMFSIELIDFRVLGVDVACPGTRPARKADCQFCVP